MSAEDLALDSTAALKEKEGAPEGPIMKTKRTWWGGEKTVTINSPADSVRDVEAGPEPRKAMLLAPLYNGIAVGLSVCELRYFPMAGLFLGVGELTGLVRSLCRERHKHPTSRNRARWQLHPTRAVRTLAPVLLCVLGMRLPAALYNTKTLLTQRVFAVFHTPDHPECLDVHRTRRSVSQKLEVLLCRSP